MLKNSFSKSARIIQLQTKISEFWKLMAKRTHSLAKSYKWIDKNSLSVLVHIAQQCWMYNVAVSDLYGISTLESDVPNSNNSCKHNSHRRAILVELSNCAKTLQINNQICNWKLCWKKWSAVVRCALMKNVSSSAEYKKRSQLSVLIIGAQNLANQLKHWVPMKNGNLFAG